MKQTRQKVTSGWLVLVYRVPSELSNNRVSVWRELKRLGALYLQQCACIIPARPELREGVDAARERVTRLGGSSNLFEVSRLDAAEEAQLLDGFRDLVAKQYAEIVEECETKFVKEVEFERFRQNYTYAEAEEIEQDLEKISRWYQRVRERDWFDAHGRDDVESWLKRCQELLDGFYADVHAHHEAHAGAGGPEASEVDQSLPRVVAVPSKPGGRRTGASHTGPSFPLSSGGSA